jgi:hypothetical protein
MLDMAANMSAAGALAICLPGARAFAEAPRRISTVLAPRN